MENYYYISESVYKAFPNLKVSKPFASDSRGGIGYVGVIDDFNQIEDYFKSMSDVDQFTGFAYECVDSLLPLTYQYLDFDEEDNEVETEAHLTLEQCKGRLVEALEYDLGISKEQNIAYAIWKLAEANEITPIEVANITA